MPDHTRPEAPMPLTAAQIQAKYAAVIECDAARAQRDTARENLEVCHRRLLVAEQVGEDRRVAFVGATAKIQGLREALAAAERKIAYAVKTHHVSEKNVRESLQIIRDALAASL
jgi:hypothetical protein